MDEAEVIEELKRSGALKTGHFKLSSGRHSDAYVQCALLLKDPEVAVEVGRSLAKKVGLKVDLVLCPALGAMVIGFTTALALGCDMLFAERAEGAMRLRRGFEIAPGSRVLLVEDVITTGGSILELVGIAEEAGGSVVAIACVVDRGDFRTDRYPLVSLAGLTAESSAPEDCPLCREGRPLDAPGSRHKRGTGSL